MSERIEDLEKFTDVGTSYQPYVSIRRNGQIGLSSGAGKRFNIDYDKYKYVTLYYSESQNVIGIKPEEEQVEGAIKMRSRKSAADISAKSFIDKYGIDHEETRRFKAEWNDQHNMIIVHIDEEINSK